MLTQYGDAAVSVLCLFISQGTFNLRRPPWGKPCQITGLLQPVPILQLRQDCIDQRILSLRRFQEQKIQGMKRVRICWMCCHPFLVAIHLPPHSCCHLVSHLPTQILPPTPSHPPIHLFLPKSCADLPVQLAYGLC